MSGCALIAFCSLFQPFLGLPTAIFTASVSGVGEMSLVLFQRLMVSMFSFYLRRCRRPFFSFSFERPQTPIWTYVKKPSVNLRLLTCLHSLSLEGAEAKEAKIVCSAYKRHLSITLSVGLKHCRPLGYRYCRRMGLGYYRLPLFSDWG